MLLYCGQYPSATFNSFFVHSAVNVCTYLDHCGEFELMLGDVLKAWQPLCSKLWCLKDGVLRHSRTVVDTMDRKSNKMLGI